MTMFIECIYEFFNNHKNLAEFEKWKEAKASKGKDTDNDEVNLDIESGCILDGCRNSRVN